MTKSSKTFFFAAICVGVFLRAAISLNSYSGEAKPPMFGDYEAQRHWQEVTVNLPINEWYEQTAENDLQYWGLDYPPLTAYHSYAMGKAAQRLNGQFVELNISRGISTDDHKLFMRWTVLAADLLIYIPAVILACLAVYGQLRTSTTSTGLLHAHILLFVVYPGQMLIDNAHFQYNNVSLGLALLAIAQIICDHDLLGAFFFVLSLNYKQMELYHALPFFFYLLARCFQERSVGAGVWKLIKLGVVVLTSFAVLWLPWLGNPSSALQVLHRLFPVARGVFEDKVSNVWCVVNVFYKLKLHFDNQAMAMICLTCTVAAVLPSCIALLFRPQKDKFMLALVNSSLAFFLFSFQVHEKTILVVALPMLVNFAAEPFACLWFLHISTFSMLPLLLKDGLLAAYLALTLIYLLLPKVWADFSEDYTGYDVLRMKFFLNLGRTPHRVKGSFFIAAFYLSHVGAAVLCSAYLWIPPPDHLEFLYPLLVSAFSCVHFVGFFIYFNYKQLFC